VMKRFLVFTFPFFSYDRETKSDGGWDDFNESFDSLEDAKDFTEKQSHHYHNHYPVTFQVVDAQTMRMVYKWEPDCLDPLTYGGCDNPEDGLVR